MKTLSSPCKNWGQGCHLWSACSSKEFPRLSYLHGHLWLRGLELQHLRFRLPPRLATSSWGDRWVYPIPSGMSVTDWPQALGDKELNFLWWFQARSPARSMSSCIHSLCCRATFVFKPSGNQGTQRSRKLSGNGNLRKSFHRLHFLKAPELITAVSWEQPQSQALLEVLSESCTDGAPGALQGTRF